MSKMYTTTDNVNIRESPEFGNNKLGSLYLAQEVEITGPKQGDRWMPCRTKINGTETTGFVSSNVLRDPLSELKENLIQECITQWLRFDRGTKKEYQHPFVEYVGEFWQSIGMDIDGLDRDIPWSSAFISHIVKKAGGYTGFVYAASHSRYCHKSIRSKLNNESHPFWGFKIDEHKPGLGDMVCRWRYKRITYEHAANNQWYKSHCDIVVSIEDDNVFTIGGNVSQSVRHTRYAIDNNGYLKGDKNVYAVLRNNM